MMHCFRGGHRAARIAALLGGLTASAAVAGQSPPGSLDAALQAAARLSGREIIYPADAVRGRPAPAVPPAAAPDDTIRALLRGTGLEPEFRSDVIVLRQAPARSAASDGARVEADQAQTVVVTATRIRGEQSSSQVRVVQRRDAELAGLPDLGEVIRRLPQNFAGGQNPTVTGGGDQGGNINATGSSNVNLRGLGEDATLTLVNGHRVASDGVSQGVDISTIPLVAISRIEVVADGASALYGSDAVGGVVNVILRPDYSGLLATTRVGASLDGGNRELRLSGVAGTSWRGGGAMLAGEISRNGPIGAGQRSYAASLDPSFTLFPRRRQVSAVAAGHQRAGSFLLGLDAEYSRRESSYANPFFTTGPFTSDGLLNRPLVDFHAVTPSLRAELPAGWTATLTGTESRSLADLRNDRFSRSAATALDLRYRNLLRTAEAGVEGRVLELPGGDVRLAAGAGFRSLDLRVKSTSTSIGVTRTTADYGGAQHVTFGYGELSIPLFGRVNAMSLAKELRFDLAARYEDYRGLTSILTPKMGVTYAPVDGVTLKGTWGRSFKAPTLYQQNQIRQSALIPGAYFAGVPANRTVFLLGGGGNPLRPERAETWSGTVEVRPSDALRLSATYYDVRFRDRVATAISNVLSAYADPRFADLILYNPTPAQLDSIIATLPQGLSNQTGQPYDPANVAAVINNGLQNLAQQHVRGLDATLALSATLPHAQRVGVTASLTYLESDQRLSPGQALVQRAGTIFNPPHWRAQASASWERGAVTMAGFANYVGENEDTRYSPAGDVGSFATFDATVRLRRPHARGPLSGLEAGLSIHNVFDERPAAIPNLNPADPPYDSTNSSVLGRTLSITLSKSW